MGKIGSTAGDEKYRIPAMALLVDMRCLLAYHFHRVLEGRVVPSRFFYILVTLAAVRRKRKGLAVVILLALLSAVSHPPHLGLG